VRHASRLAEQCYEKLLQGQTIDDCQLPAGSSFDIPPSVLTPGATDSASSPSTSSPNRTDHSPTLGLPWGDGLALNQQGYGKVRPMSISNGGDPTGNFEVTRWLTYGGPRAIATGMAEYLTGNEIVADGKFEPAVLVAFNLGTCRGIRAYAAIEWYHPQHAERFDPHKYINICTGEYVGNP